MENAELVKMSSKGQLVVPEKMRKMSNFKPTDRFMPFPVKGGVFFKKITMPDTKAEFAALTKQIQKQFSQRNITQQDVEKAIQWAKKRSS